ncbi:MAG: hypothetical protein H7834_10615 [Magnetococcus sp. YQC-9]
MQPATDNATPSDFLIGLDLGQSADYSALTVLQRFHAEQPSRYHLRHLERFRLGTPYPDQVERVKALISREPLQGKSHLIVDQTGVGKPVVDMLKREIQRIPIISILIHGGDAVGEEEGRQFRVPKRDLVGALQLLLQSKRLQVAEGLQDASLLVQELLNFKVKINAGGHDTFEAWREGAHDDLVLSAAMSCWYGEHKPHGKIEFLSSGTRESTRMFAGFGGGTFPRDFKGY